MIPRLAWRDPHIGESRTSFEPAPNPRGLGITFHAESLKTAGAVDQEAVLLLREISNLELIRAISTDPSESAHFVLDETTDPEQILVRYALSTGERGLTSVPVARQWSELAAATINQSVISPVQPDTARALADLLPAQASLSMGQDLFVTISPTLTEHLDRWWINYTNPRKPIDALKIVGLFLRSRGEYIYGASDRARMSLDRGGFYWVLARERLPSMWRYFSLCLAADRAGLLPLGGLGESILTRGSRALQARDAIGFNFYREQNRNVAEEMLYHFEYLTLALTALLDAEARVIHQVYGLTGGHYDAGFGRDRFTRQLRRAAPSLDAIVSSKRFKSLLKLLSSPRNSIHAEAWQLITVMTTRAQEGYLVVPSDLSYDLEKAATELGGADKWGLNFSAAPALLEPYSYACALIEETMEAVNPIADETDLESVVPRSSPLSVSGSPPSDGLFEPEIRRRVSLLG